MNKKWLSLLSLICAGSCAAILPNYRNVQPSVFLFDGARLCDGIYVDATSFQYNRPAYRLEEVAGFEQIRILLLSIKRGHGVVLPPLVVGGVDIRDSIWCINLEGIPFIHYRGAFYPITQLGRYSTFFKSGADPTVVVGESFLDPTGGSTAGISAMLSPTGRADHAQSLSVDSRSLPTQTGIHFVIDMNNGRISVLSETSIKHLRLNEAVLDRAFRKDKDPDLLTFLLKYNQQYPWSMYEGDCH